MLKGLLKFKDGKELDIGFPIILKDSNGYVAYWERSDGYWSKREHDLNGNEIYYENSRGAITDNRKSTELTVAEIEEKLGYKIKIIK